MSQQTRRMSAKEVKIAYSSGIRDFRGLDLTGSDFSRTILEGSSFYGSKLNGCDFSFCKLTHSQIKGASARYALFVSSWINASDLIGTDFTGADFSGADFTGTTFAQSNLSLAKFGKSWLQSTDLSKTLLRGTKFNGVVLDKTHLTDIDVSTLCDARKVKHRNPSHIDWKTVLKSSAHTGLKRFMLDCGTPEVFAEYMIDCARSMVNNFARQLMQSTFISYGGPDEKFARKLYDSLRAHGVVTFFFPETSTVGERIDNEVFRRLQEHDRVLLVCSQESLDRVGVINEIQEALDREAKEGGTTLLLPIMLDDYVLTGWKDKHPTLAERIGRRIIADFRGTQRSKTKFDTSISRVVEALKKHSPSH